MPEQVHLCRDVSLLGQLALFDLKLELVDFVPDSLFALSPGFDHAALLNDREFFADLLVHLFPDRFDTLSDCLVSEHVHGLFIDLSVQLLQLGVVRHLSINVLSERRAVNLQSLAHGSLAFLLADVGPGGLDAGHVALVDCKGVGLAELEKRLSCDEPAIE